jgi:hypothetical protein
MLVVSNAYLNPHIRPLIPEGEFIQCLNRTIELLERLSPMSPVFRKNLEVLCYACQVVADAYNEAHMGDPRLLLYDQKRCRLEYAEPPPGGAFAWEAN